MMTTVDESSGMAFFSVACMIEQVAWNKSRVLPGNTKGGSITVPLTSSLTGLESAV